MQIGKFSTTNPRSRSILYRIVHGALKFTGHRNSENTDDKHKHQETQNMIQVKFSRLLIHAPNHAPMHAPFTRPFTCPITHPITRQITRRFTHPITPFTCQTPHPILNPNSHPHTNSHTPLTSSPSRPAAAHPCALLPTLPLSPPFLASTALGRQSPVVLGVPLGDGAPMPQSERSCPSAERSPAAKQQRSSTLWRPCP